MEAESLLNAVRRRWWVVVLLTVLGALAGALPSSEDSVDAVVVRNFDAAHTLLLSSSSATQNIYSDPITFNQLQLFATTGEVPRRVADRLGFTGPPAELALEVVVEVDQLTGAIRFSTTQTDAARAVLIADAFAEELTSYLSERQDSLRESRLAAARTRLDELQTQVEDANAQLAFDAEDPILRAELDALSRQYSVAFEALNALEAETGQLQLTTLERAEAIEVSSSSGGGLGAPESRVSRGLLLGAVGFAVGIGVAVLLARLDRRIRTKAQAEALVGVRSQVSIPLQDKKAPSAVVVRPGRHDTLSDAYRTLRSVVGFVEGGRAHAEGRAPVVLVVSAGPGDGKTGLHTLAINTDFRRPSLSSRILGYKPEPLDLDLHEISSAPVDDIVRETELDGLALLDFAGVAASPGELARATAAIVPKLATQAEAVVIDSSPIGATAEVLELVPQADIIVFVVRLDHTSIPTARRTVEVMRALTEAQILLAIVGEGAERTSYYYEYSSRPIGRRWFRRRRDES
jgi:capsular polysaccharide biosynthesis protein